MAFIDCLPKLFLNERPNKRCFVLFCLEKSMAESLPQETRELIDELKLKSAAASATTDEGESGNKNIHSNVSKDPSDGTEYEWNEEKRAWFPKIDEDFIAVYQMNYGFNSSEPAATTEEKGDTKTETTAVPVDNTKSDAEPEASTGQKRKAKEPPTWFQMDDSKNTNVYVSGLPAATTDEEFIELMSKCGIIMEDSDTRKLKIKLYRDNEGNVKGDGRCCYLKIESVDLALNLLDDADFKGKHIKVEKAHFQMKGEFNASLKPKKKKKKKNKKPKGQEKLLDWVEREEKTSKLDRIVIIKNMFDPHDFEKDPTVLLDLKDDIKKECEKYGAVRKVIVFDRHADGVVSVGFGEVEPSDACLNEMNGRWFAGRKLIAERWDGVTKYNIEETEEEKEARLKQWEEYLEQKEDK